MPGIPCLIIINLADLYIILCKNCLFFSVIFPNLVYTHTNGRITTDPPAKVGGSRIISQIAVGEDDYAPGVAQAAQDISRGDVAVHTSPVDQPAADIEIGMHHYLGIVGDIAGDNVRQPAEMRRRHKALTAPQAIVLLKADGRAEVSLEPHLPYPVLAADARDDRREVWDVVDVVV